MTTDYLLGIDLGTSSVKVGLFEAETFRVVATYSREYSVLHPQPGYAEQNPQTWWDELVYATRAAIERAPPGQVIGIGIDGQMHGLVCLGEDRQPVHPAIIWADTRATTEVEDLAVFQKECGAKMPGPPANGFAAASALWLSRRQPQLLEQTKTILCPKDYVRLRLTGQPATDPSDAAGTWLLDSATLAWAPEVVAYCGLTLEQMPQILPSTAVSSTVTKAASQILGISPGIPVVTGSADMPAQALGHGIIDPESILVTVGTGGQVFRPRLAPQPDLGQQGHIFTHNVPGRWYALAAILSAGLSLRWLRDTLGWANRPGAYAQLSKLAANVPAGAEGLIFLPYLAGERTPHMDSRATGMFLGLRLHHETGHLARAVMEGVGFALLNCLKLVDAGQVEITLSGGVTKSEIWPQILADIWRSPLQIPVEDMPRACLAAAILAGVGSGLYQDIDQALAGRSERVTMIQPKDAPIYIRRYQQFQRLYPLLKEEMHAL